MRLEINDVEIKEQPGPAIESALGHRKAGETLTITLARDARNSMGLYASANRSAYWLNCDEDGVTIEAEDSVDAAAAMTAFNSYIAGDDSWRQVAIWEKADDEEPGGPLRGETATGEPPALGIIGVLVVIAACMAAAAWISDDQSMLDALPRPFNSAGAVWAAAIALVLIGVGLVMTIAKMREVRAAARWQKTSGRIVTSKLTQAVRKNSNGAAQTVNVPLIEYEFTGAGQKVIGSRVSIGDDPAGLNIESTLAKYSVGALVTVYYDPKNPRKCVLERDPPRHFALGCLGMAAALMLVVTGGAMLIGGAPNFITHQFPNAREPRLVVFAGLFGLVALLMFLAAMRGAAVAGQWPVVKGMVTASSVRKTRSSGADSGGTSGFVYEPIITYQYNVGGRAYEGHQIVFNVERKGSQSWAQKVAARYTAGKQVEVRYEPDKPSNAALEHKSSVHWLILAVAIFCFGVAAQQAGVW